MNKIFSVLVLSAVILAPQMALAQVASQCTLRHAVTDLDAACTQGRTVNESVTKAWGMCCILDAVYTVTDWLFVALMVVVGLLIAWGGFTIATAGGAPDKVASGRSFILYALIGLAVALLARALPSVVKALLGV